MNDEIIIKPGLISDHGWNFKVSIGGLISNVLLTQDYWKKITHGSISPQDLVRIALEIVMARNLAESLPPEFSLDALADRIQNFEHQAKQQAHAEAAANPR